MSGWSLDQLKAEFHRAFAEPTVEVQAELQDYLLIQVGAQTYAVLLASISGLYKDRTPTPAPGGTSELVGMVELVGEIVPVYDLRKLTGTTVENDPRWLVTVRHHPLGLAFDRLIDSVAVDEVTAVLRAPEAASTDPRSAVRNLLQVDAGRFPILDLAAIAAAAAPVTDPSTSKES